MITGSDKIEINIKRVLGHKQDIPGAAQWRFMKKSDRTDCWNCNNWVYTLVFWNEQIGIYNAHNNINIDPGEKSRVI